MDDHQTQELEIEALKAIYTDDFKEAPPPKVWKGASTFPEFMIRVKPNDTDLHGRVEFILHVKFSKTYPRVLPTLSIDEFTGLSKAQTNQLLGLLKIEGQKALGREMIFELITFCQDWITTNNTINKNPIITSTSLAAEMVTRAANQQQEYERQSHEEQERQRQLESERAAALVREIDEKKEEKRRIRIMDTPIDGPDYELIGDGGVMANVYSFDNEIKCKGFVFHSVGLSNPILDGAGTMWRADPQCEVKKGPSHAPVLEVYRVVFDNPHYKTNYGYRKILDVQREIEAIKKLDNPNLVKILAIQLDESVQSMQVPRLNILMEQRSGPSLRDVLLHSDGLREDRALDYLGQLLFGLGALHAHNICHRGLTAECIALSPVFQSPNKSLLKIGRSSYHTRILELHRSNQISPEVSESWTCPESWIAPEALEKPLDYPPSRDIWAAGVILLQMLKGFAVVNQFEDHEAVLDAGGGGLMNSPIGDLISAMFSSNRKRSPSCMELTRLLSRISGPVIASSSIVIPENIKTPMPKSFPRHSPETGFSFVPSRLPVPAAGLQRTSRYKEDWEELEFLGKGGFGSVVKARNKLDGRIYAIKKVKLRGTENDDKIFREIMALSRLNHRYIVRYYATWLETVHRQKRNSVGGWKPPSSEDGDDEDDEDEDEDSTDSDTTASRSKPRRIKFTAEEDILMYDLDDLTVHSRSKSGRSFPSIHFGEDSSSKSRSKSKSKSKSRSTSTGDEDETDEDDSDEDASDSSETELEGGVSSSNGQPRAVPRILYIQMEFVEQQTLRELIIENGLSEDHAWTLFRQVLEAVVHMASLGIIHRDFKPSNIFLSANGDCKIGDFGLATSSLAAVDPSDVEADRVQYDGEMTTGVGTSLYVAPEVQYGRGRNHSKADMYSLGIVFFEMNYKFNTGAERVAVLQQLRQPEIIFPRDFDRPVQRKIITSLLQHDPAKRPTATELFQSALLPQQMEDAYFKEASRLMTNPESPHYEKLLAALFNNPVNRIRDVLYDEEERPEHAALDGVVEDRLIDCFQLHGAVSMDPLLLMPAKPEDVEDKKTATFLDRQGDLVALPKHMIQSFARLAARTGVERIKRFHIGNIYRNSPNGGHPKILKVAVFDIITSDPTSGVSEAEAIALISEIIDIFPGLNATNYDIHISHSKVCEVALSKLNEDQRRNVISIIDDNKTALPVKRTLLTKQGLARATLDDLEALLQIDDVESTISRLSKTSFGSSLTSVFEEIRTVVRFATVLGVKRRILFKPRLPNNLFTGGFVFEILKGSKRSDVIASGGRYDQLLAKYRLPTAPIPVAPLRATGVQIAVDKITAALAAHQRASIKQMIKEKRTYGLWSPRRCDVYVCDYQTGHLADRLEIAALLWQNNIRADIMYEAAVDDPEDVTIAKCQNEGILFLVYHRGTVAGRPILKIKSVLRGTEQDVLRHELVSALQMHLLEQSRFDKEHEHPSAITKFKDASDVPMMLSTDAAGRKHRHTTKNLYQTKANSTAVDLREMLQNSSQAMVAVDVHPAAWNAIVSSQTWLTSDTAWRTLLDETPQLQREVAMQLREHINNKRNNGQRFIFLFSLRDEKVFLYHFQ